MLLLILLFLKIIESIVAIDFLKVVAKLFNFYFNLYSVKMLVKILMLLILKSDLSGYHDPFRRFHKLKKLRQNVFNIMYTD